MAHVQWISVDGASRQDYQLGSMRASCQRSQECGRDSCSRLGAFVLASLGCEPRTELESAGCWLISARSAPIV